MVEKIEAYKTKDGGLYESETEAVCDERKGEVEEILYDFIKSDKSDSAQALKSHIGREHDFVDLLLDNVETICGIVEPYKEAMIKKMQEEKP
jgi:hypothetical protein